MTAHYDPAHRRFLGHSHAVMRRSLHPLSIGLRIEITLHPQAAEPVPGAPGLRCGSCVFRGRQIQPDGARHVKCAIPGRSARDRRTDLRTWWPACNAYQARTP